ncbi:MAG TPA: hypothetical protein VGR26_02930 [Acidimicrobiales bacterium]|nr:hypothetical protein [Acidimicrobiales bacterium]
MIVYGVVLGAHRRLFLVTGIILVEPLVIAFGVVASAGAPARFLCDEARWWRRVFGKEPWPQGPATGTLTTRASRGQVSSRRPPGRPR